MQARDWFGVVVRLYGVYRLVAAYEYLFYFVGIRSGLVAEPALTGAEATDVRLSYLAAGIMELGAAAILLVFAEPLTRLLYGRALSQKPEVTERPDLPAVIKPQA